MPRIFKGNFSNVQLNFIKIINYNVKVYNHNKNMTIANRLPSQKSINQDTNQNLSCVSL